MDNKIKYFGPEDHWLSSVIPIAPLGLEHVLTNHWNRAAFMHDVDYSLNSGKINTGFFAFIWDYLDRERADEDFYNALKISSYDAFQQNKINYEQYMDALQYAKLAYKAVRVGGKIFYKKHYMNLGIVS